MKTKNIAALVALCMTSLLASACADAHASPPITEALAIGQSAPMLNSAGDHVYVGAEVDDGTGIVTTVAATGTYVAVKSATLFAAGETDGSGCVTLSSTDGTFTIAARCGVGEYELVACINDVVGENSAVVTGAWHRTRSAVTTQIGPITQWTEAATAVRKPQGCIRTIHDASLSDAYDFRYDSGTNADTVTTRGGYFYVKKLLNK